MTDQQPTEIRYPLDVVATPDPQPAPKPEQDEK